MAYDGPFIVADIGEPAGLGTGIRGGSRRQMSRSSRRWSRPRPTARVKLPQRARRRADSRWTPSRADCPGSTSASCPPRRRRPRTRQRVPNRRRIGPARLRTNRARLAAIASLRPGTTRAFGGRPARDRPSG
jgi:hypothetical protein